MEVDIKESQRSSRRPKQVIQSLLTIIVIFVFAYYLWTVRGELTAALSRLGVVNLLPIITSILLQWVLRAFRDHAIYTAIGHDVGLFSCFYINNIQTLMNNLPMKAGTVWTALYLKRRHKISYGSALLTITFQSVFILMASCFCAAMALILNASAQGPSVDAAIVVFLSIFAVAFAAISIKIPTALLPLAIARRLEVLAESSQLIKRDLYRSLFSLALSFGMYLVSSWRIAELYSLTGSELSWSDALVIGATANLGVMVAFTPAALGIREFFVGVSSVVLSLGVEQGVVVSSIERVIVLAFGVVLAIILWRPHQLFLSAQSKQSSDRASSPDNSTS